MPALKARKNGPPQAELNLERTPRRVLLNSPALVSNTQGVFRVPLIGRCQARASIRKGNTFLPAGRLYAFYCNAEFRTRFNPPAPDVYLPFFHLRCPISSLQLWLYVCYALPLVERFSETGHEDTLSFLRGLSRGFACG